MPGLIQKSGYIKPGNGGGHYAEYIATREGVELIEAPPPSHDGGGYLDTESADAYLPRVLADVLEGKLNAFGKRMGHLLFKLSVDQNLMGNILAADIEIDPDELRKARVRCVKEVKETNGEISFEDAVRYQQEAE